MKDERTDEAFSSYEISLFARVTAQITTAIENSELVRQIKERDRPHLVKWQQGWHTRFATPSERSSPRHSSLPQRDRRRNEEPSKGHRRRSEPSRLGSRPVSSFRSSLSWRTRASEYDPNYRPGRDPDSNEKRAHPIRVKLERVHPFPGHRRRRPIAPCMSESSKECLSGDGREWRELTIAVRLVKHISQSRTGRLEDRLEVAFSDTDPCPTPSYRTVYPILTTREPALGSVSPFANDCFNIMAAKLRSTRL